SLRDLLLATPSPEQGSASVMTVEDVMTENVLAVAPDTDQEEVARTMAKYDFAAMPVIDAHKRLLGVITFDDMIDVLTQEQTEDIQRIGGIEPTDTGYFQTGFWMFIRKRAPWLMALFISEFF